MGRNGGERDDGLGIDRSVGGDVAIHAPHGQIETVIIVYHLAQRVLVAKEALGCRSAQVDDIGLLEVGNGLAAQQLDADGLKEKRIARPDAYIVTVIALIQGIVEYPGTGHGGALHLMVKIGHHHACGWA